MVTRESGYSSKYRIAVHEPAMATQGRIWLAAPHEAIVRYALVAAGRRPQASVSSWLAPAKKPATMGGV